MTGPRRSDLVVNVSTKRSKVGLVTDKTACFGLKQALGLHSRRRLVFIVAVVARRRKGDEAGKIGNGREDVGDVLAAEVDCALLSLLSLEHGLIYDFAPELCDLGPSMLLLLSALVALMFERRFVRCYMFLRGRRRRVRCERISGRRKGWWICLRRDERRAGAFSGSTSGSKKRVEAGFGMKVLAVI